MNGIPIEIPREAIAEVAREVFEEELAKSQSPIQDDEAEQIARILKRINAKQFITISEFAYLFGCSRGYVDKLIEKAQHTDTKHPVPYIDLDGLIQFDRVAVLEWARQAKPRKVGARKSGGKKTSHLREVKRAVNQ